MKANGRWRLFVALDLPEEVREAVVRWGAEQLSEISGARHLEADSLHVTLCFLGACDATQVNAIADAVAVAVGGGSAPVGLALEAPLWLPRRRPRAAAVGLSEEHGGLASLQATLAGALARGGWYTPERRPFLAHITVAKIGGFSPTRPLTPPAPLRFIARSISLYRSHTGSTSARYERLATASLQG